MKEIKRYTFIHNNMVLGGLMRSDTFVIEADHKAVVETMQKRIEELDGKEDIINNMVIQLSYLHMDGQISNEVLDSLVQIVKGIE